MARIDCIETYRRDGTGMTTLYIPRIWSERYQCMVDLNRAYRTKGEAFQAARYFSGEDGNGQVNNR